jgi:hypothetical protein
MNTIEIDTLFQKHPHSRPVFKGAHARNRLPRLLSVPSALAGNTDPDHRMGQHGVATYIKNIPTPDRCLKGICQKQITQTIKRTCGPCGKYESRPSNGTTLGRYIHRRQLTRGILRYNRTSTTRIRLCQFHEQTLPSLDVQYRSNTRRRIYRV